MQLYYIEAAEAFHTAVVDFLRQHL